MPHGSKVMPSPNSQMAKHFGSKSPMASATNLNLMSSAMSRMDAGFQDSELSQWIQKNINKRECTKFTVKDSAKPQRQPPRPNPPPPLTLEPLPVYPSNPDPKSLYHDTKFLLPIPIPGVVTTRQSSPKSMDRDKLCYCGFKKYQHSPIALSAYEPGSSDWKPRQNTDVQKTDAFGEIEFVGYGQRISKYIRVDDRTDTDIMIDLMTKQWNLELPNLLISVTGGAKNFTMRPRLKEVFRRGLMKAAESTGAWIVTGGMHAGVMKHVGEAVRDYTVAHGNKSQVVCIGISPWGAVNNKESLIEKNGKGLWPAMYRPKDTHVRRQSPIDPNHSHFIMVDNGTQHIFGTEIAFRTKLESAIGRLKTATAGDLGVSIPVVCVVLEGGPGTLETVKSAIQNGTPAVIVEGSGRAADILAFAYANSSEEEVEVEDSFGKTVTKVIPVFDEGLWEKISEKIKAEWKTDDNLDSRVNWVKECLEKRDHMTVFQLEGSNSVKDIDLAILQALLKVNKNNRVDQLRLALAWNRIDIAKSEIFTDDMEWEGCDLDEIMFSAIMSNRVDFVDLFMENGFSLKDFLTVRCLLRLYNNVPQNSLIYQLLKKRKNNKRKHFSLRDIGLVIQDLTGDYYQPLYLRRADLDKLSAEDILEKPAVVVNDPMEEETGFEEEEEKDDGKITFDEPTRELFIWAVLNHRLEMAMLFWEEGKEGIAAALTAQKILKTMKSKTDDSEVQKQLRAQVDHYEDLAVGVLSECYMMEEKRTGLLLVRELPMFGLSTVMQLAVEADNKRFIAHAACQYLLNKIWMGRMHIENGLAKLMLCMVFPPLVLPLVKFQSDRRLELHADENVKEKGATGPKAIENQPKVDEGKIVSRPTTSYKKEKEETVVKKKDKSGLKWWEKIAHFFNAPSITFYYNCVSFLFFLLIYSYVLLVEFTVTQMYPNDQISMSIWEMLLIVWVASFFIEEIRQLICDQSSSLKLKLRSYITDKWNILDVIAISSFILGLTVRCVPPSQCLECFKASRFINGITIMTFFFRILHMFSINKMLGPKLVMIGRMMVDLSFFVVILLVFVTAYGVATQAMMYPGSNLDFDLIRNVLQKPYFQIFGELFMEEIEGQSCPADPCPEEVSRKVVPFILGVYMIITNVLMLNLLIAMFSYTFSMIQDRTDQHWYFQRYFLIKEYYDRPPLMPPLIFFNHIFLVLRWFAQKCCRRCLMVPNIFKMQFTEMEEKQLIMWENINADEYLRRTQAEENTSQENRIKEIDDRMESMAHKVDEIGEGSLLMQTSSQGTSSSNYKLPAVLDDRLTYLEEQLKMTAKALNWIIDSMADKGISKGAKPSLPDIETLRAQARARREEEVKRKEQELKDMLQRQVDLHVKSRTTRYPATNPEMFINRAQVSDQKVFWDVEWEEYEPIEFTDSVILAGPSYADVNLLEMDIKDRPKLPYNQYDTENKVDRRSLCGEYQVKDGIPLNPKGRTGLCGRGVLGHWGPNLAGDPIVTRWLRNPNTGEVVTENGKGVLQFVSIQRSDNKEWAIPGGIRDSSKEVHQCLKAEFVDEALGDMEGNQRSRMEAKIEKLWTNGAVVYEGYADDHRNTDNAWLETTAINYHDGEGSILKDLALRAGDNVEVVRWQRISSRQPLYGGHMAILQKVTEMHKAAF